MTKSWKMVLGVICLGFLSGAQAKCSGWNPLFPNPRNYVDNNETLNVPVEIQEQVELNRDRTINWQVFTAPMWNKREWELEDSKRVSTFTISGGTLLDITVEGETDLSGQYVISPDGWLDMTMIEDRIYAQNKTYEQLSSTIEDKLKRFFHQPKVSINAALAGDQSIRPIAGDILVFGQFSSGGTGYPAEHVPITGSMTMARLVSEVGGIADQAKEDEIYVLRREPNPQKEGHWNVSVIRVNFFRLLNYFDLSENINLQHGDIVYVPQRARTWLEEFNVEWNGLLDYLNGALTWDFALQAFGFKSVLGD